MRVGVSEFTAAPEEDRNPAGGASAGGASVGGATASLWWVGLAWGEILMHFPFLRHLNYNSKKAGFISLNPFT